MEKVNRFLYHVRPDEHVTLQVTPSINLGKLYAASLDSTPLAKPANGKYEFDVNFPVGQIHFFSIEFGFQGAGAGAQYNLQIDGNSEGNLGPFAARVVNGDPMLRKTYQFEVTANP